MVLAAPMSVASFSAVSAVVERGAPAAPVGGLRHTGVRHSRHDERDRSVLLIDDDEELGVLIEMRLAANNFTTRVAYTAADALVALEQETFDTILLDLRLGDANGLDLLVELRRLQPDVPVIILSAHGTIELAVRATQRGAFGFITKPFHDHELLEKLSHAVETVSLRREVAGLRRMVGAARQGDLVGTSRAIRIVREVIARVAATDVTVLITGESGTGKELAARSLHEQSLRATRPFVAVNCAALPADLLESELFGHVRGAFTGAMRDRDGVFAAAAGGTLFLDEIGDASPSVQAKLLRVLQERRFTRVGSTEEHEADVRIVAATNRDLRADVNDGRFREDLLFRIHVVPVRMPTLRERAEDIPLLAETLLDRAVTRHGRGRPTISAGALERLLRHPWPGNVRELANVLEAASLFTEGADIDVGHLETLLATHTIVKAPASDNDELLRGLVASTVTREVLPTLREVRESVERSYLLEVLRRTEGNVAAAARVAGRNRSDFYDILRKHGISKATFRSDL